MFVLIIGFTTPVLEIKQDKRRFEKALSVAIIVDFVIYYTLISRYA